LYDAMLKGADPLRRWSINLLEAESARQHREQA
jgi:hypothetical protein